MIILTLVGDTWNDLYTLSGLPLGQAFSLQVQTPRRLMLDDSAAQPADGYESGIETGEGEIWTFNATSAGAWAKPINGNAQVAIMPQYGKIAPFGLSSRAVLYGNTIDRLATQALDYRDDAIARGLGYYSYNRQTIAAATKAYVRFQCPAERYVVLLGREIVTNNTHVEYRTYTAWTGGTVGATIPIRNLRSDTSFATASTINYITGATPTAGTDVTNFPIYGSEGAGNRVSGGSDSSQTFRLLAPGSSFLIEWENLSASPVNIFTQYTWFELSPQVII